MMMMISLYENMGDSDIFVFFFHTDLVEKYQRKHNTDVINNL